MAIRRIVAILKKQIKDTLKNPVTLILFVFFPIMSLILTETIAKNSNTLSNTYFSVLFSTIYVGLIPTVNMANIIAEEKEKHTLRVLIMSNVKPLEYLAGIGINLFILCSIGIILFTLIGGFAGLEWIRFVFALMLGVITSLLLGATAGILSENQMSANGIVVPFAVISAFLPMIASFSEPLEKISQFLYTQQVNYLIMDLSSDNFSLNRFLIIILNMLIYLALFIVVYKRKGISEQM